MTVPVMVPVSAWGKATKTAPGKRARKSKNDVDLLYEP
jgi:hypothetical protein